jgi:hypothetical protein
MVMSRLDSVFIIIFSAPKNGIEEIDRDRFTVFKLKPVGKKKWQMSIRPIHKKVQRTSGITQRYAHRTTCKNEGR